MSIQADNKKGTEGINFMYKKHNVVLPLEIASGIRNADVYGQMATRLGEYNTMRGGTHGYGGFVFEEMHAANEIANGANVKVLGNNGVADFVVKDAMGNERLAQAKAGYTNQSIDWSKYQGQSIVVDRGNKILADKARRAGLEVQESKVSKKQADLIAKVQQCESKVLGKKNAPLTATLAGAHNAGVMNAKMTAKIGVPIKVGENIYDVLAGNKELDEAVEEIVVDSAAMLAGSYVGTGVLTTAGTAMSALSATTGGTLLTSTISSATAAAASSAIGSSILAGASAVSSMATAVTSTLVAAPAAPLLATSLLIGTAGKAIYDNSDLDYVVSEIEDTISDIKMGFECLFGQLFW